MAKVVLIILLLCTLTPAEKIPSSVFFSNQGVFYAAQNKWLVAIVLDVEPYIDSVKALDSNLRRITALTHDLVKDHLDESLHYQDNDLLSIYKGLINSQKPVLRGLSLEIGKCQEYLNSLNLIKDNPSKAS